MRFCSETCLPASHKPCGLLRKFFLILSGVLLSATVARAAEEPQPPPENQTFDFKPVDEQKVPEQFRLDPKTGIAYQLSPVPTSSTAFSISELTFPSPVVTPHPRNNTVHCEYFCPTGDQPRPGVIVLHILGGDFELSRLFCRALATRGCSALFLKMPYYGPRREPGVSARMISNDPRDMVRGMTQAVKDVRYATAWLASRPEINTDELGIMGISLGGITGALSLTAEPRLRNACLLLAGGDIGSLGWEARELREVRKQWEANGGDEQSFRELMRTVDPATYGANVHGRRILMLNARHDEVIPPSCTTALWEAFGKPEIVWWDAGHYSAARYMFEGLDRTSRFFAPQPRPGTTEPQPAAE